MVSTARDQVLRAVGHLDGGRGTTFAAQDVIDELHRLGTTLADSTIRTHVTSRMCANAPSNHGTVTPTSSASSRDGTASCLPQH